MSSIEVSARIYYSDNEYWDISKMVSSVDILYGRNQPFMYQKIEVNKLYFSSLDAFWTQNADQYTPRDQSDNILLPSNYVIDGQSKVYLEAYGKAYTLVLERHESSDDIVSLVCYNSAYYLQNSGTLAKASTIHFESGVPYIYGIGPMHDVGDKYQLSYQAVNDYYRFTFSDPTTSPQQYTIISHTTIQAYDQQKKYYANDCVYYNNKFYICLQQSTGEQPSSSNKWTSDGEFTPLYIEGTGSNLFKYFQLIVANYDEYVVDAGYSYDWTASGQLGQDIKSNYTLQEIQLVKSSATIQSDDTFKLRVNNNYSCWEMIKQMGGQSNRWPFFYDRAYFVDYKSTSVERDVVESFDIDYGIGDDGLSKTRFTRDEETYDYIDLYSIVKNADQGSEYVQTTQQVYTETYNAKVSISDSINASEGYSLYMPYPESDPTDPSLINNKVRNQLVRKIAFNRIVQNYMPSDAVTIQFSEVKNAQGSNAIGVFESVGDLPTTGVHNGEYAIVMEDNLFQNYYVYDGSNWTWASSGVIVMGEYVQTFRPYTVVKEINDVQNGLVLNDVALACVEIMWPECITEMTFGNPEFMDAQKQWKQLSLESQISTIQGTEGSLISDRYASKLVIGNQTMSDLQDDREGFTGLIMEKNYDNELYRLSGYNDGVLQAYFNSKGEIVSGDDNESVIINHDGITIKQGGGHIDPSVAGGIPVWDAGILYEINDIVQYNGKIYTCINENTAGGCIGEEPGVQDQNVYWQTTGNISVWSILDHYNQGDYAIYNGSVYKCKVDTGSTHYQPDSQQGATYWESTINTSNGNVSIIGGSSQSAPSTDTSKQSKTVLDSNGLTTYNASGNPVCRVGTDGNIYGINLSVSGVVTGVLSADHIDVSGLTVGYATSAGSQNNAGSGYVYIDSTGLRAYNSQSQNSSRLQAYIGTDGNITAGAGAVRLGSSGLYTYDQVNSSIAGYSYSTRYYNGDVVIYNGHKYTYTYSSSGSGYIPGSSSRWTDNGLVAQCYVGSTGQIMAGNGYVTLNTDGLTIQAQSSSMTSSDTGAIFVKNTSGTTVQYSKYSSYTLSNISSDSGTGSYTVSGYGIYSVGSSTGLTLEVQNGSTLQLTPRGLTYYSQKLSKGHSGGIVQYRVGSHSTYTSYDMLVYEDGTFEVFGAVTSSGQTSSGRTEIQLNQFRTAIGAQALAVYYAQCTTIRSGFGWDQFDYVSGSSSSNVVPQTDTQSTPTSVWFGHDSGAGFYYIIKGLYQMS